MINIDFLSNESENTFHVHLFKKQILQLNPGKFLSKICNQIKKFFFKS